MPAPRTPYDVEVRERALALVQVDGLAAAHAATGVPKATLSRWAREAGVDVPGGTEQRRAAGQARAERMRAALLDHLEEAALAAADYQLAVTTANLDAARAIQEACRAGAQLVADPVTGDLTLDDPVAAAAIRRARLLNALLPVRDAVGVTTRAVHDLQLLRGEATERAAVNVVFAVPRPVPVVDADVLELPAGEG